MNRIANHEQPDFNFFHRADVPYRILRRLNMDDAAPRNGKHGNKLLSAYPDRAGRHGVTINEPRAAWKHYAGMGRWSRRRLPAQPNRVV